VSTTWILVITTGIGCYLLKLAGYLVPARVLDAPRVRRLVELLPVALLAALVIVQAVADGRRLEFDGPRLAGIGAGAVAVWRRAPFIVVIVVAAVVAGLLRLGTG
jgi:branched-subunit amino acid transport protein